MRKKENKMTENKWRKLQKEYGIEICGTPADLPDITEEEARRRIKKLVDNFDAIFYDEEE